MPGVAAYVEDSIANDGFYGLPVLAVRRDAEASTVGANGDYSEIQTDATGRVKVNAVTTTTPSTAMGVSSLYKLIAAASTNGTLVATGAHTVNDMQLSNPSAVGRYFKMYNKATAPTVGTDTAVKTIFVPANTTLDIECGSNGIRFPLGIGIAITGGVADSDTTVVVAGDVIVNLGYV